jgi:hypothetical protein
MCLYSVCCLPGLLRIYFDIFRLRLVNIQHIQQGVCAHCGGTKFAAISSLPLSWVPKKPIDLSAGLMRLHRKSSFLFKHFHQVVSFWQDAILYSLTSRSRLPQIFGIVSLA